MKIYTKFLVLLVGIASLETGAAALASAEEEANDGHFQLANEMARAPPPAAAAVVLADAVSHKLQRIRRAVENAVVVVEASTSYKTAVEEQEEEAINSQSSEKNDEEEENYEDALEFGEEAKSHESHESHVSHVSSASHESSTLGFGESDGHAESSEPLPQQQQQEQQQDLGFQKFFDSESFFGKWWFGTIKYNDDAREEAGRRLDYGMSLNLDGSPSDTFE